MFPGLPRAWVPLDELKELLLSPRIGSATRDAVWAHLVYRARTDGGAWTVGCVGVALPGLVADAARLVARFAGDSDDIDAAVLSGFLAALAAIDLDRPWIMQRLRMAARTAGKSARREALRAPTPTENSFGSRQPRPPSQHPDLVLARAVADDVLSPTQADLIGTTRLEKISLRAYADARGLGYEAVRKARARAERALITYLADQTHVLSDGGDHTSPDDHTAATVGRRRHRSTRSDPSPTATGRHSSRGQKMRRRVSQKRCRAASSEMRGETARRPDHHTTQEAAIRPTIGRDR